MDHRMEEQQILGGEQDFEVCMMDESSDPDQIFFNQVAQALQEIIVDQQFQKTQTGFMRKHCEIFENREENKNQYILIFQSYQNNISKCLEDMLQGQVPGFTMQRFTQLLYKYKHKIDEQILEILTSFSDFQVFKELMLDYKSSIEEEERYRILTVKTNKIPEHKKVKGAADNIFGNSNPLIFGNEPLKKKNTQKKGEKKQKTQEQLLLPDLLLTIRPLRKS